MTADIQRGQQLQIFPCVPKSGKTYNGSEHPQRVPITVVRRVKQTEVVAELESSCSFDTAVAGKQVEGTENVYYVHPEWKSPKRPEGPQTRQLRKRLWDGDDLGMDW